MHAIMGHYGGPFDVVTQVILLALKELCFFGSAGKGKGNPSSHLVLAGIMMVLI